MKKYIILSILAFSFIFVNAQTSNVNWPFGAASYVTAALDSGTVVIPVSNTLVYANSNYTGTSDTIKSNITLTATISSTVKAGSRLLYEFKCGTKGTPYTITLSNGFVPTASAISGVASKRKIIEFFYNGTAFRVINVYQID